MCVMLKQSCQPNPTGDDVTIRNRVGLSLGWLRVCACMYVCVCGWVRLQKHPLVLPLSRELQSHCSNTGIIFIGWSLLHSRQHDLHDHHQPSQSISPLPTSPSPTRLGRERTTAGVLTRSLAIVSRSTTWSRLAKQQPG